MTLSIVNSTYETCPICSEDFTDDARTDIKKVVELSCHHFFHVKCLTDWFSHKEDSGEDLSCGYCCSVSIPKNEFPTSFTEENITNFFEKIKQDPISQSDHDLIACVTKLDSLSESLTSLLNGTTSLLNGTSLIVGESIVTNNINKNTDWIEANIEPKFQRIAARILVQLYMGSNVVRTLEDRVKHLANIPYNKWPAEIEQSGVVVCASHESTFGARVSKQYMEQNVISYLCERMKEEELFKSHLEQIGRDYYYDSEVVEALPYAQNLQKDFSELLQNKTFSSVEEMLSSLEEGVKKMQIKDNLKENVILIINKVLFRRGALRTLPQEIKRWEETPVQQLPPLLRYKGVRVLDQDDLTKDYRAENFKELLLSHPVNKRKLDAGGVVFLAISVGIVARWIFNKLS